MTYKQTATAAVKDLLELAPAGLPLHQIAKETGFSIDEALVALTELQAVQEYQNWCLPTVMIEPQKMAAEAEMVKEEHPVQYILKPIKKSEIGNRAILKCIQDAGAQGITIIEIARQTGFSDGKIYQAMTDMRKVNVPIKKTIYEKKAFFTFGDAVFTPDGTGTLVVQQKPIEQIVEQPRMSFVDQLKRKIEIKTESRIALNLNDIEQLLLQTLQFEKMKWEYTNGEKVGAVLSKIESTNIGAV